MVTACLCSIALSKRAHNLPLFHNGKFYTLVGKLFPYRLGVPTEIENFTLKNPHLVTVLSRAKPHIVVKPFVIFKRLKKAPIKMTKAQFNHWAHLWFHPPVIWLTCGISYSLSWLACSSGWSMLSILFPMNILDCCCGAVGFLFYQYHQPK